MALDIYRKNELKKPRKSYDEIMKDIVTDEFPLDPLQLVGERSFDDPKTLVDFEHGSNVQEFYRDATIFITGGTGFMGKMLIEKLSRACPQIKHIYLMIRNKKGKAISERIDAIFEDRVRKVFIACLNETLYLRRSFSYFNFYLVTLKR